MEEPCLRMLYDALRDAAALQLGINDMILRLSTGGFYEPGDTGVPTVAFIGNAVDIPFIAQRLINLEEIDSGAVASPALVVYLNQPASLEAEINQDRRDGEISIALSYLSTVTNDAVRTRNALYTNRALQWFFANFNDSAHDALRIRRGIHLYYMKSIEQTRPDVQLGAQFLAATTQVVYKVRDLNPLGL